MAYWTTSSRVLVVCALGILVAVTAAKAESPQPESLEPSLVQAIRTAELSVVRQLLDERPGQLHARDERGWTPLMHAAFYADADCVGLLLERGSEVPAVDIFGATALHYAATDLAKTRKLLEAGADVNAATHLGITPLMLASRGGQSAPIIRLLLGRRANVHARNNFGTTALMVAASAANRETVGLLLDRGADPDLRPYRVAFNSHGESINTFAGGYFTAFEWAAQNGDVDMLKLFIDYGAGTNRTPRKKNYAFLFAVMKNRMDAAKMLLDQGADIDQGDFDAGWTPLMWAAANEYGDAEIVKLLLEHGVDVNALRGGSYSAQMGVPASALMIARRRGETEIVSVLKAAGAKEVADPWSRKQRKPPERNVSGLAVDDALLARAISAALPGLQRTAIESKREFLVQGQNCISCHNQLLPLMAVSLAKKQGAPHDEAMLKTLRDLVQSDLADRPAKMGEALFDQGNSIGRGYTLWALAFESVPSDFFTDAAVHSVAVNQSRHGWWSIGDPRPPINYGEIAPTALGIRALTLYPLPGRQQEFDERTARARQFLERATPRTTEEYAYRLLGLAWAGAKDDTLKQCTEELAALQRSDGGWAQLPKLEPDAYATGQALYALRDAGGLTRNAPEVRRGLTFLIRNQMEDGSWFVRRRAYPFQPTMDPKFPHGRDGWISAAGTSWAVMALAISLDQEVMQTIGWPTTVLTPAIAPSARLPQPLARAIDYRNDVLPLLEDSCLDCHSGPEPAGGYEMESRRSLIRGSSIGPPVVIPGDSANSLLIHHVADLLEDVEMPPIPRRDDYEAFTPEQISMLRAWIDQGLPGFSE